ncbi:riboflavin biosynthesis pyrimidine reductase [Antricoccus suffuscus]|uniref:Riboflavin biosynthesis pyrimidine reductase n=1 Tax=Antricoccus suffuscus TaxID=1629062 RepID=A0A2T1A5V7_9ACTN|nr:pyrimidine reductase family protein [Antricoccus suffuscus]PRZ43981.1 riboflavin biosynthesis pyrimidine reductase [Antricoccus suffuscus]
MRRLYPAPADEIDLADIYPVPSSEGRYVRVNMVSSVDGAATVDGRVGALTSAADQALLHRLREIADVVLVGAGTVRAEGYGPIELSEETQQARIAAGQAACPPLAIVTGTLRLDLAAPLFTEATTRPIILTAKSAPQEQRDAAAEVADVVIAGEETVDLMAAIDALKDRGLTRVLSEGGPHLLAQLLAAGLLDELCLAIAPLAAGEQRLRVTAGPALQVPATLHLAHVLEEDDYLFMQYNSR